MRLLADQVFIAAAAVRHQRRQIALRTGRKEQRALEAESLGRHRLQAVHGRIVAVDIIADLGRRHGGAHARRRPGHGVAAQIRQICDGSHAFDAVCL